MFSLAGKTVPGLLGKLTRLPNPTNQNLSMSNLRVIPSREVDLVKDRQDEIHTSGLIKLNNSLEAGRSRDPLSLSVQYYDHALRVTCLGWVRPVYSDQLVGQVYVFPRVRTELCLSDSGRSLSESLVIRGNSDPLVLAVYC